MHPIRADLGPRGPSAGTQRILAGSGVVEAPPFTSNHQPHSPIRRAGQHIGQQLFGRRSWGVRRG